MNKRPLIGLTCYKRNPSDDDIGNHYHLHDTYSNSLHSVGATSVILPYTFDDWDILDGVLFCGGGDINPRAARTTRTTKARRQTSAMHGMILKPVCSMRRTSANSRCSAYVAAASS